MNSTHAEYVAKKIARLTGVESSHVVDNGSVSVILNKSFRNFDEDLIEIGSSAMIPVKLFERTANGTIVSRSKSEAIEDFYTQVHIAGFAGSERTSSPDEMAGKFYSDKDVERVSGGANDRDVNGQLKLTRIRSSSRGREVTGWRHGEDTIKTGDKVKFKKPCVLQWTMGRTVKVQPGMLGKIMQVASRTPLAYLSMGGHDGIELPVHAVGHVYDVMTDVNPAMESNQITSIGFVGSQLPKYERDTPNNSPNFKGYKGSEEDMLFPKSAMDGKASKGKKGDDRTINVPTSEPKINKKKILFSRR